MKAEATQLQWLNAFTVVALLATGILAYWINLNFLDFGLRVTAALALMAQFLTLGLLAEGGAAKNWRRAAIVVGVVAAVFMGWSWLTPGMKATWLNRSVILMVASVWSDCSLRFVARQSKHAFS